MIVRHVPDLGNHSLELDFGREGRTVASGIPSWRTARAVVDELEGLDPNTSREGYLKALDEALRRELGATRG